MGQLIALRNFFMTFGVLLALFVAYTLSKLLVPMWWEDNTPSDRQILRGVEIYSEGNAPDNFKLKSANHVYSVRGGPQSKHDALVEVTFETTVDFYNTIDYRSGLKKATNDPLTSFYLKYPKGTEVTFLRSVTCSSSRCSGILYAPELVARKNLSMMDGLGERSSVTWIKKHYPNATFFGKDGDAVVLSTAPDVGSPKTPSVPGVSRSKKSTI